MKGFDNASVELTIRDLSGRVVHATSEKQSLISFNMNIDLPTCPPVFYLAEVRSGDFRWTEKLVKQ
jgi:hypothetical protein